MHADLRQLQEHTEESTPQASSRDRTTEISTTDLMAAPQEYKLYLVQEICVMSLTVGVLLLYCCCTAVVPICMAS